MAIIDDGRGIRVVCGSCSESPTNCTCNLRCTICHGRVKDRKAVYYCERCVLDVSAEPHPKFKKPSQEELIVAMDRVLEMEDDVMRVIECEAIPQHSSSPCGNDGADICQHCLTENRLSERMDYMRNLLNKLRA